MKSFFRMSYPYILWIGIFIVAPMLMIFLYAITTSGNSTLTFQFSLDNFARFFRDPDFIRVLLTSLRIAFLTTVFCLLICYPAALFIAIQPVRRQTLLILLLTLGLHVFGTGLLSLLERKAHPFVQFLVRVIDLRVVLLLFVQTGFFTAMFMALPNRRNGFLESLPGAVLASAGWLVFSNLYSIYVEHFAHLTNVYGSVYAVALSMLWLYCCMSIVFYGGVLNVLVSGKKDGK